MNTTEILLALTPENYNVPEGEEKLFHTVMEVRQFDPNTGARKSRPTLQKFGFKEFSRNLEFYQKQGYSITILHDPSSTVKAHAKPKTPLMKPTEQAVKAKVKKQEVKAVKVEEEDNEEEVTPTLEFKKI